MKEGIKHLVCMNIVHRNEREREREREIEREEMHRKRGVLYKERPTARQKKRWRERQRQ